MNLPLLILRFHPAANGALRRIPRGIYPIYKNWKEENSNLTERELAFAILNMRFSITIFESKYQKEARVKSYFATHNLPENLIDVCTAIAMVESKICPNSSKAYSYIKKEMSFELFKLGYRYDSYL